MKVKAIKGREILDSRGNPTVEVDVLLSSGASGRASVPSGASTGSHEALELRDGDKKRYGGKGVKKAVGYINNELAKALARKEFDQRKLDETMLALDGTENKSRFGANALLGISLAFAKATATEKKQPLWKYFNQIAKTGLPVRLPVPMMNIINGGKHAENSTDLQEFMIFPAGAKSFSEALRYGTEVFHALKKILHARGLGTNVGDEGGYAPALASNEAAIAVILEAITAAGYKPGKDIYLAIDAAASELYKDGVYSLATENTKLSSEEMVAYYKKWTEKYPLVSIEDGLAEDDWTGYQLMTTQVGKKAQIVGDDLFVTNPKRLIQGIEQKAGNAILIKLNQIGTVTQTLDTIRMAAKAGFNAIISHRSGETEDTTIADLAVGVGVGQIKTGSLCRTDRTAKYNQLLRIEEELGKKAIFAGRDILKKK